MEPNDIYAHNQKMLLNALKGTDKPTRSKTDEPMLTLKLSRVLKDREAEQTVLFDGDKGIEKVLETMANAWQDSQRVFLEGRLMGLHGYATLTSGGTVALRVSLDAGGQLICEAGPASSVCDLLEAVESFDRLTHVATRAMGCDYELLAEGYNSLVSTPLDVTLVPHTRWTLLTAHLSQTGRYARDVMRCSCSTTISIAHGGDRVAIDTYRLAVALSPLFAFLTDNVRSFRGSGARRCPRMVRAMLWDEFDPERCGVVPGTFSQGFSFDRYATWIKGITPILFVDDQGTTLPTGKATTREFLRDRTISRNEAANLLQTAYPLARLLDGEIEIGYADALRPQMAAGFMAFVKGLLCNGLVTDSALSLIGQIEDEDVAAASKELQKKGWDAKVYGKNAGELVDELVKLANSSLFDLAEQRILRSISELWEFRMVPRDSFVHQEVKEVRGW
ncbi:MAG: hypothetical protein IKF78_13535 [Atopobiaceae bacterium]|nr:hypothetical protein [Atopobiaceae bacterium]